MIDGRQRCIEIIPGSFSNKNTTVWRVRTNRWAGNNCLDSGQWQYNADLQDTICRIYDCPVYVIKLNNEPIPVIIVEQGQFPVTNLIPCTKITIAYNMFG